MIILRNMKTRAYNFLLCLYMNNVSDDFELYFGRKTAACNNIWRGLQDGGRVTRGVSAATVGAECEDRFIV